MLSSNFFLSWGDFLSGFQPIANYTSKKYHELAPPFQSTAMVSINIKKSIHFVRYLALL
jgi:hypothetical protein